MDFPIVLVNCVQVCSMVQNTRAALSEKQEKKLYVHNNILTLQYKDLTNKSHSQLKN